MDQDLRLKFCVTILMRWLVVLLFACAKANAPGMAVVADASAISVLFGGLLNQVLSSLVFEAEFGPVPVGPGTGRTLEGTVALTSGGISCSGRYVAQTVPVGVLANASACGAVVEVTWRVTQGGTVLCSNESALQWRAGQILAYVAVGVGGGVAASRVEVNGGNTTDLNTTCSSAASSLFVAQAAARAIGGQLDMAIAAALSAPPVPALPDLVLNMTFTGVPSIARSNISVACQGLFRQRDRPAPADLSCFAGAPPWGALFAPANLGVRLFDCFFDSLWRVLYDEGLFEGRLVRHFLGLTTQLDVSAAPFRTVLRGGSAPSASLATTVRFEVVIGDDTGIVHAALLLPVNASLDGAAGMRLSGHVPAVQLAGLNVSFSVDNYRLPVDLAVLRPVLLDVLQNELLPAFDRMLTTGLALPVALPRAALAVRAGFLELLAQVG